jgi:glyoxylase-like metal-dependent hydrolase (beta-lactamase superfamily II)
MHTHSRRGFLAKTLGACWAGASLLEQSMLRAAQARAQSSPGLPTLFDIEKVADGVWAAVARAETLLNCNAAIFENSSDLLIVDTHSKPSAVISLVSQIRKEITSKPVRYVVNSHFHWDHSQGNPAYRRIAPHADLVASEVTRNLIAEHTGPRLKVALEQAAKSMQSYKDRLSKAASVAEKTQLQRVISDTESYIREMKNYTPELPNLTLQRDLILHDKAHNLHLAFRGRGHTAGDVVVYCPQKKVVATGDLHHGFAPYIADGYPLEWPRTLLAVAEFPFEHVIGGHGAVQHTRERLYQMATYIEELTEVVVRGKRTGKSVEQMQSDTVPASLKSLASGAYGEFFTAQIKKFRVDPNNDPSATVLEEAIKANIRDIYAALDRS